MAMHKRSESLRSVRDRASFRKSLLPYELPVSRFWIHEPDIFPSHQPHASLPDERVKLLDVLDNGALCAPGRSCRLCAGVNLLNVSVSGTLVRVVVPLDINVLDLLRMESADEDKTGRQANPPRDVSMILRLDPTNDLRTILVSGKVVRAAMVRSTAESAQYELAVTFHAWGNLSASAPAWHKVGDGGVPPLVAWIDHRQPAQAHAIWSRARPARTWIDRHAGPRNVY
jgi:hypothetical protein